MAIGFESISKSRLPRHSAISSLSLAELVSGPLAVWDRRERTRRQSNLRFVRTTIEALPFDSGCALAFGPIYTLALRTGRKPRGPRTVDLMIAATALAHEIPIYTLNAADLRGLDRLIEIVDLG